MTVQKFSILKNESGKLFCYIRKKLFLENFKSKVIHKKQTSC